MATVSAIREPRKPIPPQIGTTVDHQFLRIPASAATFAGFRAWVRSDDFPEKVRSTYVDREIYLDMTKETLGTHARVKAGTSRVLMNLEFEFKLGTFFLDGVLISNEVAKVSNNPDGVFVSNETAQSNRVRLVAQQNDKGDFVELEGSPDWVMEIVSDSSVRKDTVQLRRAYHRARITEYWLIDARGEEINFQILHWRKKGYVAAVKREGWQRSRVFDRWFRLTREQGTMGLWEYTLHVQTA